MKVGDLVRLSYCPNEYGHWRGIVIKYLPSLSSTGGEWEVHWLHHPLSETSCEYGYQLEVVSESR